MPAPANASTTAALTTDDWSALERAWAYIRDAPALLVAAGAGMGVESGLPDFRGPSGLWRQYPGLARAQMNFEAIANPEAFARDPELAWGFYGHRLLNYRAVIPHPGFTDLLAWGGRTPHGVAVYTSNVDGQFQKAGYPAGRVHECHGSIHVLQCAEPCSDTLWSAEGFAPVVDPESSRLTSPLPTCARCGGLARPNVLMFNDMAWVHDRSTAQRRQLAMWLQQTPPGVVVEIGAGITVATVRAFSSGRLQAGWRLVRVNPDSLSRVSARQFDLGMPAGSFFKAMALL